MTLYERFEQIVAIALSLIIVSLIIIALVQLYERVLPRVLGGAFSLVVLPTVAFADDSAVAKSDQSQSQTEEKRKTSLGDAHGQRYSVASRQSPRGVKKRRKPRREEEPH